MLVPPDWREKAGLSAAAGARAPAASSGLSERRRGGSLVQMRKRAWNRDDSVFGGTIDTRDFLFVATGAVAGVGAAASVWTSFPDEPGRLDHRGRRADRGRTEAGAEGQDIKVFWLGKPDLHRHRTKKADR